MAAWDIASNVWTFNEGPDGTIAPAAMDGANPIAQPLSWRRKGSSSSTPGQSQIYISFNNHYYLIRYPSVGGPPIG